MIKRPSSPVPQVAQPVSILKRISEVPQVGPISMERPRPFSKQPSMTLPVSIQWPTSESQYAKPGPLPTSELFRDLEPVGVAEPISIDRFIAELPEVDKPISIPQPICELLQSVKPVTETG